MATDSAKTKMVIRTLLLGVLLAASVAAALGYTVLRRKEAGDIVAELRDRGLSSFHPAEPVRLWYRQTQPDTVGTLVIGWRAITWVADGEFFRGTRINYTLPNNGSWEFWILNEDATEGTYYAGVFTYSAETWIIRLTTAVRLADGQVTVAQRIGAETVTSTAEAPNNYLPEGAVDAAIQLMLDRRGRATFSTFSNNLPPDKAGKPQFLPMSLGKTSREELAVPSGTTVVRTRTRFPDREIGSLLFYDHTGRMVKGRYSYHEETLMPPEARDEFLAQTGAGDIHAAIEAGMQGEILRAMEVDDAWRLAPVENAAE